MKNNYILSFIIILVCLTTFINPLAAQKRYKHLPRIKVEKNYSTELKKQNSAIESVTKEIIIPENISGTQNETVAEESYSVEKTHEVKPVQVKKRSVVSKPVPVKKLSKEYIDNYTEKLKNSSKLFNVKDVKKPAIIGYLIWFIVVLVLGIALLVLAFIFLGIIAYTLYYIFLSFGVAVLVIALFIIIFGLTGIL